MDLSRTRHLLKICPSMGVVQFSIDVSFKSIPPLNQSIRQICLRNSKILRKTGGVHLNNQDHIERSRQTMQEDKKEKKLNYRGSRNLRGMSCRNISITWISLRNSKACLWRIIKIFSYFMLLQQRSWRANTSNQVMIMRRRNLTYKSNEYNQNTSRTVLLDIFNFNNFFLFFAI